MANIDVEEAQASGDINAQLTAIAVLYAFYARACDPVLEFWKMSDLHCNDEIMALVMSTCFEALNAHTA